jgi:hypothetical protein
MIVVKDQGRCVVAESRLDHLRVDVRRTTEGIPKEIFDRYQAMPSIQVQHPKDLVLTRAEVDAQEFVSQCRRWQNRRTGSIALRQERVRAIEHVGGVSFPKTGLIANVEGRHGGGPYFCRAGLPAGSGHAAAQQSMIEDRRRRRTLPAYVIDGENGVVPCAIQQARPPSTCSLC